MAGFKLEFMADFRRKSSAVIDPEFESLCPDVLMVACLAEATRALAPAVMVDCRAAFHMERLA